VISLAEDGSPGTGWVTPPAVPALAGDEVHVWRFTLNLPDERRARLLETMSADEQGRSRRFHFERHRRRFIAGRGLTRLLLARYLGREPARLRFCYGTHGKPALAEGDELRFNVSHSGDAALLAVTRGRDLGIDLEEVRARDNLEELARRFFASDEVAALATVVAGEKEQAFFNCWTRKEAFVKALGEGLSRPLDQFTVSLRPGEPARLLAVAGDSNEAARWTFRALDPWPGFAGCLAVRGPVATLKQFCVGEPGAWGMDFPAGAV
jgi:4'-phosphopantetheinyl transferase